MRCQNPIQCKEKYLHWEKMNELNNNIEDAEILREELELLIEDGYTLPGRHVKKRELDRAFSRYDINTVIKDGWVIEHNKKAKKFIVMYNVKFGVSDYRPIHVVVGYGSKWKLITVYDPRTHAWKWAENYQKRICFCD